MDTKIKLLAYFVMSPNCDCMHHNNARQPECDILFRTVDGKCIITLYSWLPEYTRCYPKVVALPPVDEWTCCFVRFECFPDEKCSCKQVLVNKKK